MRVLIIEDEPKVALFIEKGLNENGYITDIAYDGVMGKKLVEQNTYNAIVLDVNLPLINGYELCAHIRTFNKQIPIIMLTAFSSLDNKLDGFNSGADDYLIKPFEFRELLARVKALMNRSSNQGVVGNTLKVDDLEMNLDTKSVTRGGRKIELTAKEFALLLFFIRSKGRMITRSEIAEKVWDINFNTGTNIVDVYVNFLRKKIDKDFPKKLIHTQIGMGYILRDDVE